VVAGILLANAHVSHGLRPTFVFTLGLVRKDAAGVATDLLADWGATIKPFSCTRLTDRLISEGNLQVTELVLSNNLLHRTNDIVRVCNVGTNFMWRLLVRARY
jgi:hypothetical protein